METPVSHNENPHHMITVLLAHEHARARAWMGKNRQALDVLLAPDFIEVTTRGRLKKSEVLEQAFPYLNLHDVVIESPLLVPAGPQSAILTYRCRENVTAGSQQVIRLFHVAAHYVKPDNRWQLLLWQITPYPRAGDPSAP